MNITLTWLEEHDACPEGRLAFAARFPDGATATETFAHLAELQRADWLIWLCNATPEFAPAVGACVAANGWQSVVAGVHEANTGYWLASGSATVRASGSATVQAYGSATVQAYDSATVRAYGSATVRAYDSATVRAYGSATVQAYGSATVQAYDSATVRAYGSATVQASDSATVQAYDSATVQAYDSATVQAYDSATVQAYGSATVRASDSATVLLQYYAAEVNIILHGPLACAIDRRDGTLKLITAENEVV